jgi:hypothetical protein
MYHGFGKFCVATKGLAIHKLPMTSTARLRGAARRFGALTLCLVSSCGGRVEPDPDRETLFATATDGSIQHAHSCEEVRNAEVSSPNGLLPKPASDALRSRIDEAEIGDVRKCLAEVETYDECFLALPCDAFAEATQPVWLAGADAAPCGCGVVSMPFAGPLPQTLASCASLLPVSVAPARPGFSCPE